MEDDDFKELLGQVAEKITSALPEGFSVDIDDRYSMIVNHFGWESETLATLEWQSFEPVPFHVLALYLKNALTQLQDFVSEASHEPWPSDRLPMPDPYVVQTQTGELHFGFGRVSDPTLTLGVIGS